ncbi:Pleiotropic drug resistance protein 1 [Glycine max]|nr:Pleiotropic drug resistance protein 1 [Glycine max]
MFINLGRNKGEVCLRDRPESQKRTMRILNSNLIVTILHKRLFMASFSDWMDGVRVAIAIPTIEVRFENMNIGAEVHVGSRALPIFTNYMVNKIEFTGKVTYNGHGMNEFSEKPWPSQHESKELGLLMVFRREKEANITPDPDTDVYMKILGLEVCADTIVGNAMLRGISGGQRKHVTTGEMLVGPANALFMDEISTGLDSSTTYQILNSLKQCVHILKGIAVISLLQPAPETYNLFYDIILLSDSHIVYQGPREYVLQFFESIGFKCPERKAVADFLQEMASALFRFISAVGREMTVALTLGSFILASLVAMSGFVLSKDNIKKWWLWGFWISPMMYGQNAMVNNEFLGMRWRHVLPNSKEPLGVEVLKSRGFFTQSYWYWIAVGALIGYTLLFNFGYILALMYLSPPGKHRAVISEEPQSNEQNGGSNKGSNVMRHIKYSYTQRSNSVRNSESGSTSSQTFPARQRGMVLPFEPYSITFDEVTYAVDMPQEMRNRGVAEENLVLLKGVRGTFRSGVLTALMGITGTGKTTLMDVLAGRKTGGYVGGNIKISGYRKKQETFARISGYCEQNDIHSPHVTVYESLLYSSWLRLSPDINVETRKIFIEEVMQLVELKPLRHALVGLPGVNGISTEQRKRLTIAVELVENPSIIFMDEPTSGLDARAAAVVMRTVRNTVDTGRTVVCTIHQPSIDIFESFDELMKQGGQQIYVGPLGQQSSNLISYFEGIKGVSKIKDGYNPATWMLEVTTSAKEIELGIDFAEVYKNSELYRRNKALVKELSSAAPGSVELYFPSQYSTSFFTQCMACLWKQHWSYWRNSQYTAVRFLFSTSIAVLFGSMFWNLGSKIVGIDLPTIEVRFENLSIEAEARAGTRALPTFTNFIVNILEGLLNSLHVLPNRKQHLNILEDVSGIIKPGRMTLLLGPPSSGKTTLLLALAGKLDPKLKFSGKVTYNGHGMNEFVPQRTAAYVNQNDLHVAELTVRETLAFSARVQGVGPRYDLLAELSRREKEANIKPDPDIDAYMKAVASEGQKANMITDYILRILGLEVCADTVVGNAMLRGISGGQRKRVTTGEMLVGPAKALFMDEISTGLDSSTTFQIVNSLKQYVHILKGTTVISLLQPAPETYNLFDDIILLSDSHIVYQGPREHVLEFFELMGFKCPQRKGVADFLQEVTSRKDQEQYWAHKDQPYRFVTAKEFSEAHKSFHIGRSLGEELATEFDKSKSHPAALTTKMYGVGKWELLKACLSREYLLMKRNSFVYTFKLCQLAVLAIIAMTIFLRTEMHRDSVTHGGIYVGALFYGVVVIMFNGLAELSMVVSRLPVFYKQRDYLFFPSWVYALPAWILKIPLTFVEVGVWVFLTYYAIGFDPYVGRLFRQYLVLVLVNQMASALFRLVAAVGREMTVALTLGSFTLAILFAMSGFVLSKENIKKWWLWGFWISPMMYGQNAMVNNEFLGKRWRHFLPNSTEALGVEILKSRGFFTQSYWYWIGVGALIGYTLLFNFGYILALTYLNPLGKHQAVISEEPQINDQSGDSKKGTNVLKNIQRSFSQHSNRVRNGKSLSGSTSPETNHNRTRGMILPSEPHSITFDDVTYSVDMPVEMRNRGVVEDKLALLKGVSGAFRPGVLTALMGVTGAGKTTLMDVLAGRKTGGYIGGNITISGYPKKQETFARISGYCEQNDIHSPHVTVYESLLYSAWLRLSPEINADTRKMFIEEVMELVELKALRNALVGLPGINGLSTEQRKRLTIAVELVANPSIIFMDEPTSGLDARAAAIVMRTVRNTVDTGRTVVCTIHQPSIDIFESFDELLLMKQGGQEIYVGPLGHHSSHLINYFEGIQGVNKIKDGYNPATWMLEVSTSAKEMELGIDFAEVYKNSELYRRNKALIKELSTPAPGSKDLYFPSQYSTSFLTQCMACLWKQHWSYWRNPLYTAIRFLYSTAVAAVLGSMFWDLGSKIDKQQDLFNAMGSMYAAVLLIGIKNANAVQPVVAVERTVLIELPYVLVQAVVYGIIIYAMIGFEWTVTKVFWYLFFMYFTFLTFTYYGMMSVAVTPNQHISSIVSSAFYAVWNLFSGFIVPRPRIPVWWRWYSWANPVAWSLYGLVASQYGDIKQSMESSDGRTTVEGFVRSYFGFKHDFLGVVAAVIVAFPVVFALVFAISVKMFNFQRR